MRIKNILYMLLLLPFATAAQISELEGPTAGLSPTAKSFQRYGEIPVSLYTGTPDISIPLATMKSGNLTLPVELSYHSGGIKADDRPGPTGLGWTLIAGGAITREKYDLPDELDDRGFLYKHSYISSFDKNPALIKDMIYRDGGLAIADYDLQPDKFSFNFPGYSGFFIMDTEGEWHVVCSRPLKVESYTLASPISIPVCSWNTIPAHNSKLIKTFVLVGEDGTRYEFGNDAIDLNIDVRRQNSATWEASAWYLKSITAPNGDAIHYYYDRKEFIVNFSNVTNVSYVMGGNGTPAAANFPDENQGILLSPVYLRSIQGGSFSFKFKYSRSRQLDYALVDYGRRIATDVNAEKPDISNEPVYVGDYTSSRKEDGKIKWYQLDCIECTDRSKFLTVKFSYTASDSVRLMLNSVSLCGEDAKTYEQYSFSYHNYNKLPKYLSRQTDHWGYYNRCVTDIDNPLTTCMTDTVAVRFGSLREIVYPTGGKSVFEFEANTYSRVTNTTSAGSLTDVSDSIAGGIRIRRITDVPNDGSPVRTREFLYCKDYSNSKKDLKSSGILECLPEYSHKVPYPDNFMLIEYSDRPLSNIINNAGLHIGYPEVVERDGSGGYTIRRFASAQDPDYKDQNPKTMSNPSKFLPVSGKAGYRGTLYSECVYDSSDRLLRAHHTGYTVLGGYEKYVPSLYVTASLISAVGTKPMHTQVYFPNYKYSLFKIFTYSMRKTSEIESVYEPNSPAPLTKSHYYTYNSDGQLTCDSMVTCRKGVAVSDVSSTYYEWEHNSQFADRFYKSYPRTAVTRHAGRFVKSQTYAYAMTGPSDKTPYVASITETRPGKNVRTLYRCREADYYGRPLLTCNADGLYKAYLWAPDRLYPVAEISLPDSTAYTILKNLNPQVSLFPDILYPLFAQLRASLPGAMVTGYNYTPHLGVTSLTDPSGRTIRYDYDAFGRLCGIRDAAGNLVTSYGYSMATGENNATIDPDN